MTDKVDIETGETASLPKTKKIGKKKRSADSSASSPDADAVERLTSGSGLETPVARRDANLVWM